jgi:tagatose 6-phosphate kinase
MILVVGLSPAWQRTLHFDRVRVGAVNRARKVTEIGSGKCVNVARVAQRLGAEVRLLTVAGGGRGRLLAASLRMQRIAANIVRVGSETRYCQTLIGGKSATELVEEAGRLTRSEVGKVVARFRRELRKARLVVLSGSVPLGCGDDFYARLVAEAHRRGALTLVDAQGVQLVNALRQRPLLVRVTRDELFAATGRSWATAAGAQWLVVSSGAGDVLAFGRRGRYRLPPPAITEVNSIGSGDAMMAGIACGVLRGQDMPEAIRFGVACGTANALMPLPGTVRRRDVEKLLRRTRLEVYKG